VISYHKRPPTNVIRKPSHLSYLRAVLFTQEETLYRCNYNKNLRVAVSFLQQFGF
jgi:hypothetical protein